MTRSFKPKLYQCKECKEKYVKRNSTQKVCSWKCAILYAEKEKGKKEAVEKKQSNARLKKMRVESHSSDNKKHLQKAINLLARKIDMKFYAKCIDCGVKLDKQVHGSHFHNVQGNENIRWNLDNIHASTSRCNKWQGGRKPEYYDNLIIRYDKEYADYIKFDMGLKYDYVGLNSQEYADKLVLVRKLNRDFDTFVLKDARSARKMFNKLIGIYI